MTDSGAHRQVLDRRFDFSLFYDVKDGNPNSDPDAGNMPRIDPETGHGLVTDVCLKRKVRNYVEIAREQSEGYQIYVTEGAVLNERNRMAYRSLRGAEADKAELAPKDRAEAKELTQWMCDNFYDIRTFGAVMNTRVNCGQVRGPVQFTFSRSIEPIFSQEVTITRQAVTKEGEEKDREMGRKHTIPYALYRMDGFISAFLARKTGFTMADLELLWEAIRNMFEHDRSASRGMMTVRKLVVFEHESGLGNAPAHELFERISAERLSEGPARSIHDYKVDIKMDNIPSGIKIIVK